VRYDQYIYFAESIRAHREELTALAEELEVREEPLTPLEARLVIETAEARLQAVEDGFRYHALPARHRYAARLGARLSRVWARIRSWTKPRIGQLKHYEPRPLRVPAKYFATRPPEPAPTVSIVTPSFEQGRYLDRTLYSVVSQKYPALEYIVQDGGSSDETLEILERFAPLLARWVSEPDEGQGDAINRAFAGTTGEIMAWLNSDDLLLPGALAYVARYFAEHPDVDVVYGHRLMIDENDGQIGAWILPGHDDLALTLADYVPQETLFWRRRIWNAVGASVDTSFAYALDWDLLLRFRDAGAKMVRLPRYLGAFRVHDAQKTTANDEVGFEEVQFLRQRIHGRVVPVTEVLERLRPYFARHVVVHSWCRFVDRLPVKRQEVVVAPVEPWLRLPERDRLASEQDLSRALAVARNGDEPDEGTGAEPAASGTTAVHAPNQRRSAG
jgi:glycosyltransferase involved in cell wall biosynthesis